MPDKELVRVLVYAAVGALLHFGANKKQQKIDAAMSALESAMSALITIMRWVIVINAIVLLLVVGVLLALLL